MALDFPNSPTIGDEFTGGGFTWVWDGASWTKTVAATVAGSNDFALLVGVTGDTTYVLDRTYTSGRYTIEFANGDTTYDIYFIATDGTYAGYTNTAVAEVTADFSEVVVLGAATSETILFTHQGVLTSPSSAGDVATAGAFINSVVTSSLPNINDTTVVNGGNFAANVEVSFIAQDTTEIAAKAVVRSSSTQLVVTRPDSFSPDDSPYTVKVVNPGIPVPAGTNAHLLSNAVTAGTNPAWVTASPVFYNLSGTSSITFEATDTEGSDIDYSIVTGTLPAGLSLDQETGVVSGTFSGSANEGDVTSVTIRAIDAGGNFLDKAFDFTANAAPVWTTAAGALDNAGLGNAYSYQLVASTGTQGGALTYTIQSGALPDGLSLSGSGLISGTPTTIETANFTVRVTDEGQSFADRAFSIQVVSQVSVEYLVIAGGGGGGWTTTSSGGAGGGGYRSSVSGEASGGSASAESPLLIETGTLVDVTVGAGGIGQWVEQYAKTSGGNSEFAGIVSIGGGFGGTRGGVGAVGGSGGGSPQGTGAAGTSGQGYKGADGSNSAAGGGGAGGAGSSATGGIGIASSITGTSVYRGGGGSGGANSSTAYQPQPGGGGVGGGGYPMSLREKEGDPNTGGGGGGGSSYYTNGGNGGSGFVAVRYASTHRAIVSPGLTSYDITIGGNTVTVFEAGTGTVTFEAVTTPVTFSAEYVVVAGGGGGGGNYYAGGGGAGGYQAVTTTLSSGVNYGLTIGGGGTHVLASGANRYGWPGFESRFGVTQSIGGGGGQPSLGAVQNPYTGGSGGGGGGDGAANGLNSGVGALGISGQGNAGGRGFSRPGAGAGGGGGGAAAAGSNAGANNGDGGAGGAGASTTITGTTTYYAGGGGGGCRGAYSPGAGGIGGGAAGVANEGSPNPQPSAGTVNTGGGGGGAGWDGGIGGFGGSGIVIVKYPDTRTANIPVGISSTTDSSSVPGYKVTTFTAGTGTVTFS